MSEDSDPELERIRLAKLQQLRESMSEAEQSGGWPSKPVEVTDSSFDDFVNKYDVAVIDCWAPWCGPCKMMTPLVEELAQEYQGKIAFGMLNTDENQATSLKFQIMSIPRLLVFKNGDLAEQIIGVKPKPMLETEITKHL